MNLQEFLTYVKTNTEIATHSSYSNTLVAFENYLKSKKITVDNFKDTDVLEYLKSRNDLSKNSRRQALTIIKIYIRWCLDQLEMGITEKEIRKTLFEQYRLNKILRIRQPSFLKGTEKEKRKGLTLEELKKLLNFASEQDKPHIYLLAYFGMRISEYLNIKKINYEKNKLEFTSAKSKEAMQIDFNDYVKEILKKINIKAIKYRELNYRFKKYDKLLGFRIHPHLFRGTFITGQRRALMGKVSEPIYLLKLLSGHKPKKDMTDQYTDSLSYKNDLKNCMTCWHYMDNIKI